MNEIKAFIKAKSHIAVLTPLTLLPEIARLENDKEGEPQYDAEISAAVSKLCKIVIASTSECWLVSCPGMKVHSEILLADSQQTPSDAVVGRKYFSQTKTKAVLKKKVFPYVNNLSKISMISSQVTGIGMTTMWKCSL